MTASTINPADLLPDDQDPLVSILRVGVDRQTEALHRLLAREGGSDARHVQRFLDYASENQIVLDYLWAAFDRAGRMLAVVLAVPGAGRTAMCFSSLSRSTVERQAVSLVLRKALPQMAQADIRLLQALIEPQDRSQRDAYLDGGFERLAVLKYLERPVRSRTLPEAPVWPSGVSVHDCRDVSDELLITALDATYEDTLDCPGLQGIRSTADILAGHRSAGRFDPSLWTLLRIDDRPAGVLMLNPSVDELTIELVYIGLAKFARKMGLGRLLLRHGLRQVFDRSQRVISLAVDESNQPAIQMYTRENFRPVLRRLAMICALAEAPARDALRS